MLDTVVIDCPLGTARLTALDPGAIHARRDPYAKKSKFADALRPRSSMPTVASTTPTAGVATTMATVRAAGVTTAVASMPKPAVMILMMRSRRPPTTRIAAAAVAETRIIRPPRSARSAENGAQQRDDENKAQTEKQDCVNGLHCDSPSNRLTVL